MGLEVIAYRALHLTSYTAYDFERMMLWDDHVYVDLSEQRGAGHVSGLVDQGVYAFGASFSFEVTTTTLASAIDVSSRERKR